MHRARRPYPARRAPDQGRIERLFGDLELLEPGVVQVPRWRPETQPFDFDRIWMYGGAARKP
ncbi:SAM-dependent methyltransferase [Streptosporangium sp. KLBMP 9127]|nr:SAM-dependent methyltransferase [Streptosporangium sp. KLBMP 9127]